SGPQTRCPALTFGMVRLSTTGRRHWCAAFSHVTRSQSEPRSAAYTPAVQPVLSPEPRPTACCRATSPYTTSTRPPRRDRTL
ncbi:hypothetical protein KUCAC02_002909, partial [Chaenocephalus aceratus]